MRKLFYFFLAGILVLASCSKDDPAPTTSSLPTAPEAKAEHDIKSGGVYKGTFANATSSGTIKIILQDGKTQAEVTYNGVSRTLTTTALSGWTSGDAITDALFTASDWQVIFSVDGNASSFGYGLNLAGTTNFEGVIVKEVSTAQVRVYEGTYAGAAEGKWNFCTQNNLLAGVYTGTSSGSFEGAITGSNIAITSSGSSVTAVGTFTGEASACSGTWNGGSGDTGTWSGNRKL